METTYIETDCIDLLKIKPVLLNGPKLINKDKNALKSLCSHKVFKNNLIQCFFSSDIQTYIDELLAQEVTEAPTYSPTTESSGIEIM